MILRNNPGMLLFFNKKMNKIVDADSFFYKAYVWLQVALLMTENEELEQFLYIKKHKILDKNFCILVTKNKFELGLKYSLSRCAF